MLMLTMMNDNDIASKFKATLCIHVLFVFSWIIVLIIRIRPNSQQPLFNTARIIKLSQLIKIQANDKDCKNNNVTWHTNSMHFCQIAKPTFLAWMVSKKYQHTYALTTSNRHFLVAAISVSHKKMCLVLYSLSCSHLNTSHCSKKHLKSKRAYVRMILNPLEPGRTETTSGPTIMLLLKHG